MCVLAFHCMYEPLFFSKKCFPRRLFSHRERKRKKIHNPNALTLSFILNIYTGWVTEKSVKLLELIKAGASLLNIVNPCFRLSAGYRVKVISCWEQWCLVAASGLEELQDLGLLHGTEKWVTKAYLRATFVTSVPSSSCHHREQLPVQAMFHPRESAGPKIFGWNCLKVIFENLQAFWLHSKTSVRSAFKRGN